LSNERIEKILEKEHSFYRIDKPLGIWKLYTQHSNTSIDLEIIQSFNRKGSFTSELLYHSTLSYHDDRMIETKGIGGMSIGLSGHSVDDIISQAIQKIEDFYDSNKFSV